MVETDDFINRDELLSGGLAPGQKASALLFAIESHTSWLIAQAQHATAFYLTKKTVEEQEAEFLEAYASGRQLTTQLKIQDLERYAPIWMSLIPQVDVSIKAALAFNLGTKYAFTAQRIPNIRIALGLDSIEVEEAFQRLYKKPLASIYRLSIPRKEKFYWNSSRITYKLETLPPFLVAFLITIPLGSGLLAIPIALADVGPTVGIGLVILFGLISAITIAALAEAVARSCTNSFGLGYLGQLVSEYLGSYGSIFLTITLTIDSFLILIIFYLGIADTMEQAVAFPGEIWAVFLFGAVIFFLTRKSLNSTVASSVIIGIINLILLIILPLIALPYLKTSYFYFRNIPLLNEGSFNFSQIQLIFGVLIGNFSSHLLVGNYGRVILRRDPSARSWIWGPLAAIGISIFVSCLWVIAINGAVPAEALARQTGTAVTVLANLVGPVANWLGSAFIVLNLGLGSVHLSLGLYFLIDERLPQTAIKINHRSHFLLCALPALLAFLVSEWLIMSNEGSFTKLLGFVGIMTLPLLAGIYPLLLLASTRRKGDIVPEFILKGVGNPIVLLGIYIIFVGSIFVHGLFAFQGMLEKAIILLVGCIVLLITGIMLKQKALSSRAVIELRHDLLTKRSVIFNLTAKGHPAVSDVRMEYPDSVIYIKAATGDIPDFSSLHMLKFSLPVTAVDQLKVWAHKITSQGKSEVIPIQGTIHFSNKLLQINLSQGSGFETYLVKNEPNTYEIHLKPIRKIWTEKNI